MAVSATELELLLQRYKMYKARISQQLTVGFSLVEVNRLVEIFRQKGVEIVVEPVVIENLIFSYMLRGVKL